MTYSQFLLSRLDYHFPSDLNKAKSNKLPMADLLKHHRHRFRWVKRTFTGCLESCGWRRYGTGEHESWCHHLHWYILYWTIFSSDNFLSLQTGFGPGSHDLNCSIKKLSMTPYITKTDKVMIKNNLTNKTKSGISRWLFPQVKRIHQIFINFFGLIRMIFNFSVWPIIIYNISVTRIIFKFFFLGQYYICSYIVKCLLLLWT